MSPHDFLTVAIVYLLALMSPGPDFVMISRNSLIYSRKVGLYLSIGLGLGILVHATYSIVGIGLIISQSILLYSILKLVGAGYLLYIGFKCLQAKPHTGETAVEHKNDIGKLAAIRMGFLTNVLNPKATILFLALFTQVIDPHTPKAVEVMYGVGMSVMTIIWFSFVATVLSHRVIKDRFASVQHHLERTFGILLIALGIKVALSSSK